LKRLIALGAVLALALIASLAIVHDEAQANPPGAPEGLKLAFKFNYIAVPEGTDVGCGSGHRILTERGAVGHIVWELDTATSGFHVLDCETESIDDDYAWITGDEAEKYLVFVRILGPMDPDDNWLAICRDIITDIDDIEGSHTHDCLLGEITLTRGSGIDRWTFDKKLFADDAEGELWHLEPGTNFQIAEVRLYVDP